MSFGGSGGGNGSLAGSTDVFLSSPANGQVLSYNSGTLKWVNNTNSAAPVTTVAGRIGDVVLTKSDVGLANIDNTSDANKPVSTAAQTALSAKANDNSVVHLAGAETITGVKTYSVSPVVPTPTIDSQAASKSYVDTSVAGGSGGGAVASTKKSSSFTLSLAENGKIVDCESGSTLTVTVPPSSSVSWPNDVLLELCQTGAGQVIVAPGAGVSLRSSASPAGLKTRSQWSSISLRRRNSTAGGLDTTGIVARFRADDITGADGSSVSSWPESSGNGLPAATQLTTANQPTLTYNALGGHKAVTFDGANDYLALAGSALDIARNRAGLEIFIAYKLPNTAVTGTRTAFALSVGGGTNTRLTMSTSSSGGVNYLQARRLDSDGFFAASGAASTTGESAVLTGQLRYTSARMDLYKNGSSAASNTSFSTTGSTSDTASQTGFIGANAAGTAEWFAGSIAEILIYNTGDASGSVRANVHTYLQNTYGVSVADYQGASDEWIISGDTSA